MSIVIALGVTTPETSDMAAGSDPESVEASPAVTEKSYSSHSCGSVQSQYRGLPYAVSKASSNPPHYSTDHNYGAPPPPTPPASPLSQTIIPRVELNGTLHSRYHNDNSADSDSSSSEEGRLASWCHCSLMPDGLKCEGCRGLDRRKGVEAQWRKQVGESSATESGDEEVSQSTVSYTATQHTPTSITLTVNRVKRSKPKKRKKSTEKARSAPKSKKIKAFREGSRKSVRMKNSPMEASTLDENTEEGWETRIRQWTDQYEEALANQYSADVQTLLQLHRTASKAAEGTAIMDNINRTELACNNTVLGSQMQLQLGRVTRVQKHRKILRASKDLDPNTLIIEYRGKVMLKQQFEVNGHFFKRPYPFVLFYSKFNEVDMCVDARTFGNDARFIRRSCTPNAEVRHMIAEGMIHLCIYAVTHITKDTEVTIGFDYEFNSCNYKVDCACHKGNQNCPVQKHNLTPQEQPLRTPCSHPLLPPLVGAETRRRKARRKELEGIGLGEDSRQLQEEPVEASETQGGSDNEEVLCHGLKLEEPEEGEVEENGALIHSRRARDERKSEAVLQVFDNIEKRRRRTPQGQDKSQCLAAVQEELKQEGAELESSSSPSTLAQTAVGVSTRRCCYASEPPPIETEKVSAPPAASAPKPPPARTTKPRPKSRISRYRSSSSQRARRQRQALAQQAAEQALATTEEGNSGAIGGDAVLGEGVLAGGLPQDADNLGGAPASSLGHKGNLKYPKTKKYLVTEWMNDKVVEKPECPIDRPLRITTDPTVLATTLNMLPGLSHSPLICTTPKHYVRFGSPFNPERRRRPIIVDSSYGSFKKRWIKQAQDERTSAVTDNSAIECISSHQKPIAPFKKRKWKCVPEPLPLDDLLRPLSPITPPLPSDPINPFLSTVSSSLLLRSDDERHNGYSLPFSPLPSGPTSRCNTPLQFENISSPEASPVHRPESLSPEPCLRPDVDGPRLMLPDLSLPSSLGSPVLLPSGVMEDPVSAGQDSSTSAASDSMLREPSFRTEFNLIYTCSPLNANLGEGLNSRGPLSDRRHSQCDSGMPAPEPYYTSVGSHGLLLDTGSASPSPYTEPLYSSGYPEMGTPPHPSNPPQKKKRANLHTISVLTGKPGYQAISVRSEYRTVHNMVSLLEYRKRKQGVKDSEPRSGLQLPTSPTSCFSSPVHPSMPQVEEVSPPDHNSQHRSQDNTSHWMVPTSVERLREGQGVLERVLRGSMKTKHVPKSTGVGDRESDHEDGNSYDHGSPVKSPQRYSHSSNVFSHQVQSVLPESHSKVEPVAFLQQTSLSPFRGSFSPSAPSPSQAYYSRLSSNPQLTQDPIYPSSSVDSALIGSPRKAGGAQHQQHHPLDGSAFYNRSHLKSSYSLTHSNPKAEPVSTSRPSLQPAVRTLSPDGPRPAVLQPGTKLLSPGTQHYPQRGQFQASGVRTQSGSY